MTRPAATARKGGWRPNVGFNGRRGGAVTRRPDVGTDPATIDPDYSAEQVEWLRACDLWRERAHRRFLRACDFLTIALELGYRKP